MTGRMILLHDLNLFPFSFEKSRDCERILKEKWIGGFGENKRTNPNVNFFLCQRILTEYKWNR
jgi:hypothetical protein